MAAPAVAFFPIAQPAPGHATNTKYTNTSVFVFRVGQAVPDVLNS